MKQTILTRIALGVLVLSNSAGLAQDDSNHIDLRSTIQLPATTNILVGALLRDLTRTAPFLINLETHHLRGSQVRIEDDSVGPWDAGPHAIIDVLEEAKRRVPAFSWRENDCAVNLILKDSSLTDDVMLSELGADTSFSGSELDLIIWLGQMFPRFPVNYRKRGGVSPESYKIDLQKGTTLRQVLNMYGAAAGLFWTANIEYIPEKTDNSSYTVVAEVSFIRKGRTATTQKPCARR